MLDLALTPDQQLLVDTVRDYMSNEFAPSIQENDINHYYDPDTFRKLSEIGLTGICFPERYGGSGMDYLSLGLASEELEYVDHSLRTILSVHTGLCGCGLYVWGTEDQKMRLLYPLA